MVGANVVDTLTNGNAAEVKAVLTSAALAAAVYQVLLIAVAYGKLRPSVLGPEPAGSAHRASGDTLVVLVFLVGAMCLGYFEVGESDDSTLHIVAGTALLVALALKIAVLRWLTGLGRLLPLLGTSVVVLLAITWWTSAGALLGGD